MIVYMSRKHRRALHDLIRQEYGNDVPQGSRGTLFAVLNYLDGCLDDAYCTCGDEGCTGFIEEELSLAEDFVARLLDAHPRWPSSPGQALRAFRAGRWRFPKERRPGGESLPGDMPQRAVVAATELVSNGEADKVKAALAMVGYGRVSEIPDGDVPAFLAALAP